MWIDARVYEYDECVQNMGHAEHFAVHFEIFWYFVVIALRDFAAEHEIERLTNGKGREVFVLLGDICHFTSKRFLDVLRAESGVAKEAFDGMEAVVLVF